MPTVVNFHHHHNTEALTAVYGDRWLYIGRANPTHHLPASALANPFSGNPQAYAIHSKDPIADYRKWLWGKIQEGDTAVLQALAAIQEDTALVCWCKPRPCHGDIIIKAWQWAKENKKL